MRWAWRIAIVSGIPIYLHGTFTILIGFLLFSGLFKGWGLTAALSNVFFVLAIFAAIVLHELGHALTARRFGIRTRDITLLPIGGVARLERMPDIPRQELWGRAGWSSCQHLAGGRVLYDVHGGNWRFA